MSNRVWIFEPWLTIIVLLVMAMTASAAETPSSHLVVLQYHHVSTSTPASTSITPEQFTAHMDWLANNGYSVAALPEALKKLRNGETLTDKTVAITFDDGYKDNYTNAFPILQEHGWPFTIFINPEPHDQQLKNWASWDELRIMAKNGASIANHTTSHLFMLRRLPEETTVEWRTRLTREIVVAEERIYDETKQTHRILAYPYGESDFATRKLITDLGFIGFGQQSGAIDTESDFSNLPRFPLSGPYSAMDSFQTKMKSLPMPVFSATPDSTSQDGTLTHAETHPALTLQLHDSGKLILNCFASGQGAIPVIDQDNGRYLIRAPASLPVGRSRYNCTYTSEWPDRYYWYSYAWVRRDAGDVWSHN